MSDIGEVTQRLEELHDAGVAANEMGELFLTDYAMETIAMAKAKIESLEIFRRDAKVENAELHSQIESLQRENEELRGKHDALWMLLDDIDTADDMFKEDHKAFQGYAYRKQRERFAVSREPIGSTSLPKSAITAKMSKPERSGGGGGVGITEGKPKSWG